jgi:hypothetical protein
MKLSKTQLETIETFGGLNYPPEKIVMILDVDHDDFFLDFNLPDSDPEYKSGQIRYHYDLGQVRTQAEIDKANLKRAKEGNLTSIAQYKKDTIYRDSQNAKKRTIYQQEKTNVEDLKHLIETGEPGSLSARQLTYFEQLDYIRTLHNRWDSKPFISNAVRLKWPEVSRKQAVKLYEDCINFFYLDNDVKIEAWRNVYAERLDNLSCLAIELDDLEEARLCIVKAADVRGLYRETIQPIPAELLDRRTIVYDMDIEKLGIPKVDRRELAAFIDNLDLTQKEKQKCKSDAMIEGTPFELIIDDETE